MKARRWRMLAVMAATVVTALLTATAGASAQAEREVFRDSFTESATVVHPCTGEEVDLTYTVDIRAQYVVTPSDNEFIKGHVRLHGAGQDAEGDRYRFKQRTFVIIQARDVEDAPTLTGRANIRVQVVSQGPDDNFVMVTRLVEKDGEILVDTVEPECRG